MLALCIPIVCSAQKHKDRVLSTHHFQGKLVGFEFGDYGHAEIKTKTGKKRSFFVGPSGLDAFLAVHQDKTFDFTYIVVKTYIEEAGGYQRITRLTNATSGNLTFKGWYAAERKKYPKEVDFNRHYNPLIDKLTLKEDQ
jgi:hypothetical protein